MGVAKVIIFLIQFSVVFSALPQIKKCRLMDTNCTTSSAQLVVPALVAGIPELGLEPLDPMLVDVINVDLAGLKLTIRDAEIYGLNGSIIDKMSVDEAKKQMKLIFHANLMVKGKYKASGKLLILPISGSGETVIKLKNCQLTVDMFYDMTKNKDGKDVIELKSYKYNYDVKDNAYFHLGNLFNGNKGLSDTMHKFMNSSWKLLTEEFGPPMFAKPVQKVFNAIKALLKSQALEDIAIV